MKNILFFTFLICIATTANAEIQLLRGVYYGVTSEPTDLPELSSTTYRPPICTTTHNPCSNMNIKAWVKMWKGKDCNICTSYYVTSGCPKNCSRCAASNPTECFQCDSDYALAVSGDNTVCKLCMTNRTCLNRENVQSCSQNSSGCYVPRCRPGYLTNGVDHTCIQGIAHCIGHEGPTKCRACEDGYTLKNNTCLEETLEGDCPSGLTRSSDGCCCIK